MANQHPIVLGPPAFGSPDPATSNYTLTTPENLPDMEQIPMGPVGAGAPVHSPLNGLKKDELVSLGEDLGVAETTKTDDGDEVTENLDGFTKDELVERISPAIDGMSKADLSALADLAGVDVPAKATKQDIVDLLQGQRVGNPLSAPTMSVINDEATRHRQDEREGKVNPNA